VDLETDATNRDPYRVPALGHSARALVRVLHRVLGAGVADQVTVMVVTRSVGEALVVEDLLVGIEAPITIAPGALALARVHVRLFDAEVIGPFLLEDVRPVTHVGDTAAVVDPGVTLLVQVALAQGLSLGRGQELALYHTRVFQGTVAVEAAQGLSAVEGKIGVEAEVGMTFATVVQGHPGSPEQPLVVVPLHFNSSLFDYLRLV